jgi:hypothetical protein
MPTSMLLAAYEINTFFPLTELVICIILRFLLHVHQAQTKCSTMGPPFELHGTYVVPSYGLKYETEEAKVGVSHGRRNYKDTKP